MAHGGATLGGQGCRGTDLRPQGTYQQEPHGRKPGVVRGSMLSRPSRSRSW
jgi:hypothetical protein